MDTDLRSRVAELSLAIRNYPTPIARCDEPLTQLLEERARLLRELDALEGGRRCGPDAQWTNDGGFNAA